MTRIIALIGNCIWMVIIISLCITEPPSHSEDFLGIFLYAFVPAISIFALLSSKTKDKVTDKLSDLWPFVVIKRKTLEERAKIENLVKKDQVANTKGN